MSMLEELHGHAGRASQTCRKSFMNMPEELQEHAGRVSQTCWKKFKVIATALQFINSLHKITRK